MKILRNINELKNELKNIKNLGFVPTMGGLHKGHLSLLRESKRKCQKTIVTIYVNPTQFNKKKDYLSYPRNLSRDINLIKKYRIDYLYLPKTTEIYNKKRKKKLSIHNKHKVLCGRFRKNHFKGVIDIIDRFLVLIKPKYLFLGKKDFQQYFLIKEFIKKKFKTKIVLCKTIRDKNKIALSTRNYLLNKKDLSLVAKIIRKIFLLKKNILFNKNFEFLVKKFKKEIQFIKNFRLEYLEIRNFKDLTKYKKGKNFGIFFAYYIKNIRLIDNI